MPREVAPSAFELLMQAVSVPIDRFSSEAIYALEDIVNQWRLERKLAVDARRLGGDQVNVVVRSGFEEMKASPWEKEDADFGFEFQMDDDE